MKLLVQGTKEYNDYSQFTRGLIVAMSNKVDDHRFDVYSLGPVNINNYALEFCNKTETSLKTRHKQIRFYRIPQQVASDTLDTFDWFGFFCDPYGKPSRLFYEASDTDMDTALYRF